METVLFSRQGQGVALVGTGSEGRRLLGNQAYYHKLQLAFPPGGGAGPMTKGNHEEVLPPFSCSEASNED